ncbi:ADP-sugar pyrophosphatase-like [Homarus americanus]|uniref:ADP-sugar pyrophosphatase-like n=1 Tax=Homarus americanus TaxID=6706 RepID=UPI001C44B102|nr:ADP-sugar pyrophosphatase-like [Homarus americanus]
MLKLLTLGSLSSKAYSSVVSPSKHLTIRTQIKTMLGNSGTNISQVHQEEELARGKWLALNNFHWTDHTGRKRVWEVASRTTRGLSEQDSVAVTAVINRAGHPSALVLIKQFRPPLKAYTIEMPAGLVDTGETAEAAALRELKEETGFSGVITGIGRCVALDPGISNSTMRIVNVQIDGDLTENKKAARVCGVDGEHIEVLLVPISCIQDYLSDFAASGMTVDSRVHFDIQS